MKLKFTLIFFLCLFLKQSFAFSFDTVIEAELCTLNESAQTNTNENASAGEFVKLPNNTSPKGSLQYGITDIPEAGSYKLQIFTFNDNATQDVHMSVNGAPNTIVTLQPSNWAYQGPAKQTIINIDLQAGENTISFTASAGPNILLDKFIVSSEFNSYYVSADGDDTNDGSLSNPWKTLAKVTAAAASDINGGFLQAGDKVFFRSGDVFEGNLIINRSGTKGYPIEISSYGTGELPIISGSGASLTGGDYFEAIKLVNASNLIISKLWIKNDRQNNIRYTYGETKAFGILVTANKWGGIASNLMFRDLKISDVYGVEMPDEFNSLSVTGLRFEAEANEADMEVSIKDVLIEDCYFTHIGKAGVWSIHKGTNDPVDSNVNRSSNFIIKNNTFFETGGSGIILSKVNNALVENNAFDHSGHSDVNEPRLVGRGSGMWVFSSHNIMAQYNRSYSIRGGGDSYGMHIDFGNKNIIYQYNYSEDSEGGFCEVLGNNHNVAYRFNVSVNDGFRDFHGNTIWTSGYVGTGNTPVPSDGVYVYNNSIYLAENFKPDFTIFSKNTFIYNNIFMQTGSGIIGENVSIDIPDGADFIVANNLFSGNINTEFSDYNNIENAVFNDPLYKNAGATNTEGYKIQEGSPAIAAGATFPELQFPNAGQGIFADITLYPQIDAFGNPVDIRNVVPNIGADNELGLPTSIGAGEVPNGSLQIYPNPVHDILKLNFDAGPDVKETLMSIYDMGGDMVYKNKFRTNGLSQLNLNLPKTIKNGIYIVQIQCDTQVYKKRFVLYR